MKTKFKKGPFKPITTASITITLFLMSFTNIYATNYYVNDNWNGSEMFTTVAGNNTFSGLTPSQPKRSLRAIWTAYSASFTSGDTIFIDAGIYGRGGTDAITNESKFDITVSGLTFLGAGIGITNFDNNNYGTNTDYFMEINANNTVLKNMTITQYESNAPNSGTTYNRGTGSFNTGGQAISIFGCTGVLIENVNTFDNGNGGNAAIGIGQNTTAILRGGGSTCNAQGSAYSGGLDIYGNNVNVTVENYMLSNNSKDAFNGAALLVYGVATTNVLLRNCIISNNFGGAGDGVVFLDGGNVTIRESLITANNSDGLGGPYRYGAGVAINGGNVNLIKTQITSNNGTGTVNFGGVGIYPQYSNAIVTIDSCYFAGNTSTLASGKDLGARIHGTNEFTINVNQTTFSSTNPINIGGGSTNSCSGSTFRITNSGNPTITYSGSPACVLGAGSNTIAPFGIFNPTTPTWDGNCATYSTLPIELIDFAAICAKQEKQLIWSTASEKNNAFFTIEKANSDLNFETLKQISGAGNSTQTIQYQWLDNDRTNETVYYRLSQTDFDGSKTILKTISASCKSDNNNFIHQRTDNYLEFNTTNIKVLTIQISNQLGQIVKSETIQVEDNSNFVRISLPNNLNAGIYNVNYTMNEESLNGRIYLGN